MSGPQLPAAVIFDVDGLLIDTETCDFESWRALHEHHRLPLSLEDYCQSAGLYGSWDGMYDVLAGRCGESAETLRAWREPRFRRLVEERLQPSNELTALLGLLKDSGIPRGIASSSDADWVDWLLRGLGIHQEFAAVATGGEVALRKPAPDLYLLAAARLGVDPAGSVALEDSVHGLQSARAAGLGVIAIPNSVSIHQDLSEAHAQAAHFGEIDLELLGRVRRLAGGGPAA
ncbi:MAG TPA: HAD-IA family hydrolase [Thermoanaerobaculia bacterium]|nr:HAD-IA family hydrolase [Thermoanaerobaculia bacterium]